MSSTLCPSPETIIKPVVLGATGRLGSMLRAQWGADGAIWQARNPRPGFAAAQASDSAALIAMMRGAPAVVCLWGAVPGRPGRLGENVTLARAALDAADAAGAGPVLLASSAAVYGRASGALNEDMAEPASDYGRAKLEMEQMAAAHPHPSCVLRIGNVAGADAILGGWRAGMTLDHSLAKGTPRRSYIGPGALARVIGGLVRQADLPDVLNVALPGGVAMGDLLDAAGLAWSARAAEDGVIWDVTLDTTRLARCVPLRAEGAGAAAIVADWRSWRDRA